MAPSKSLSSLLAESSLEDHEEILGAAEAILQKSTDDSKAHHARVVALLNLDRFAEAVSAFEQAGERLKSQLPLEHAYALYKTGRLEEARKVANKIDDRRSLKHVEAQAAYRLEDFSRTIEIYKQLTQPGLASNEEANDVRTNIGATDALLAWTGHTHLMSKPKPGREDLGQFDTAFNAACSYIAQGELKQAEFLLRRAKDLCNAAEELSESDKAAELLPITIQQIYVLSLLGRQQEAEELCAGISLSEISDKTTRHIASTDLLFLNQPSNVYKLLRMFHAGPSFDPSDRPFDFQASKLHQNELALDLAAGKLSQFKLPASSTNSESKDPTYGVFVAAAHVNSRSGKAAIKEISSLLDKSPDNIGLLLTVIQMCLLTKNFATATSLLESFLARLESSSDIKQQELRYKPGLVALLVALYSQLNRIAQSKAELAKAFSYWKKRSEDNDASVPLMKAAGVVLLEDATPEETALSHDIFKQLALKNPSDPIIAAGQASSLTNIGDVGENEKLLPTIDRLTAGIDAAALEEAGIARVALPSSSSTTSKKRAAPDTISKSKAKDKKPRRLPKDYDPSKKPDPERWLPLRDRSTWKPNKKKKKGKGGGAGMSTQGGIVNDDSRPATPSQQQQHQRQVGQAQSKKRKGKGK